MNRTPMNQGQMDAPAHRSSAGHTSNPLRIDRVGTDHMRVHIRPAVGRAELRALVDRIEQLLDAGYETIHVVTEATAHEPDPAPLVSLSSGAARRTSGRGAVGYVTE